MEISDSNEEKISLQLLSRPTQIAPLTIDITAVFPQKLQGMRVVMLHRLWYIYDVRISIVIP